MKIHKIVYCLMNYEKSDAIAAHGVNLFGSTEEAQNAMEAACKRKYESIQAGVFNVDTFSACVLTPESEWFWSILAREIEVEVPDPEPVKKMWALSCECDTYESLHGIYENRADAYTAMCAEFKAECDKALGNTPFNAQIGTSSADFEPENGEWSRWKITPVDVTKGGAAT